jgi:ribose 5-phosphate isomerase B
LQRFTWGRESNSVSSAGNLCLSYAGCYVKQVVIASDIPEGGELRIAAGAIVTPSARDLARERGVKIVEVPADQVAPKSDPARTIAIGSDRGGSEMKEKLKPIIEELGLTVNDIGIQEDYPDIARAVAETVVRGGATRGIIIDGAGIGSCIAANKVPGIRAALCYDKASARNSREHNDSNILTLGGRLLTMSQADDVLRVWLTTPFAGGRHSARVQKIAEIEKAFTNWTPRN